MNAIGEMVDHLDDVVRERPDSIGADVRLTGATVQAIAAVEEVFRTLVTERTADRRHNPGLPSGLVDTVLGACCIVVALMRRLHLDTVTVTGASTSTSPSTSPETSSSADPA